jgi:transcriptional regulator with XRE-family HTH domain
MNRHELVARFRDRLLEVIESSGRSRSAYAELVGLDRSTLSQLLAPDNERLPRAETVLAIALEAQVSTDWLLGLSESEDRGAQVVGDVLEIEADADKPVDERLQRWHAEAAGYKIRYVPMSLPDLLKTEEVIRYEYQEQGSLVPQSQLELTEARLAYSRKPETDIEACCSFQALQGFARGEGVWRDLPVASRRQQLEHMQQLLDELYPTFRWFLFDGLQCYSVPFTVFGPRRAAIYLGDLYFVLNATEQIRVLTRRFDDLIRAAVVQPTEVIGYVGGLLRGLHETAKVDAP